MLVFFRTSSSALVGFWRVELIANSSRGHKEDRNVRVRAEYCFEDVMSRKRIALMSLWKSVFGDGAARPMVDVSAWGSSVGQFAS